MQVDLRSFGDVWIWICELSFCRRKDLHIYAYKEMVTTEIHGQRIVFIIHRYF
jgi:hypothetical protein